MIKAKKAVREYLEDIRNTHSLVTRKNMLEVKREYLNLYKQALLQLWSDSVIQDPGYLSIEEALAYRVKDPNSTRETSGRVSLDPKILLLDGFREEYKFGLTDTFASEDDLLSYDVSNWTRFDVKDLSIGREFYNAFRLKKLCEDIDYLYELSSFQRDFETGKLSKEKATRQLRVNYINGKFSPTNGSGGKLPLSESIARLYAYSNGLKRKSLKMVYWSLLYKELGIEENTIDKDGIGLFIEGISYKQELELFDLVINWKVELSGEYGKLIKSKALEFNTDNNNISSKTYKDSFLEKYNYDISSKILGIVNELLSEDESRTIVMINNNDVYYTQGNNENLLMSGQYVIDSVNRDVLGVSTTYSGDMGEYVNARDIEIAREELGIDIEITGCPVILNVDTNENPSLKTRLNAKKSRFIAEEYYPIEQVKGATDLHAGGTFFTKNVGSLSLRQDNQDMLRNHAQVAETLKDQVISTIELNENGYYGPLRVDATVEQIRDTVVSVMESGGVN